MVKRDPAISSSADEWPENNDEIPSSTTDVLADKEAKKVENALVRTVNIGGNTLTQEQLKGLTFNDLAGVPMRDANETFQDDSFGTILEDKGKLVGVPLVIVHGVFNEGDNGEFVSLYVLTANDDHYIVNDGSTGILNQCRSLVPEGRTMTGATPIVCRHGFRVSNYTYHDAKTGKDRPAKTFYIDTRA